MATKKKNKKKSTKSKKSAVRKSTLAKKLAQKRTTPNKSAKRSVPNKAVPGKKDVKKTTRKKTARAGKNETQSRSQEWSSSAFSRETLESQSGGQSGDLQGLSDIESVDSESVDELIEEGNAFEAGVVSGVERAGKHGDREVRTHEVPEDDVPGEYLDEE